MKKTVAVVLMLGLLLPACATAPDIHMLARKQVNMEIPVAQMKGDVFRVEGTGIVYLILMFPGGNLLDPTGKEGALNLLCSTMTNGGAADLRPEQIESVMDNNAITVSISPDRDYTIATVSFLEEDASKAIELFMKILKTPLLESNRFEMNRKIYIDNVKRENEEAFNIAVMEYKKHYFRGDKRAFVPTEKSVEAVTRADMAALYKLIFSRTPLIGIVGNIDEKYLDEIRGGFKDKRREPLAGMPPAPEYGAYTAEAKEKQCILLKVQPAFTLLDKEYPAAVIADQIIGSGGFSSRLVTEIRVEKGLAYSAGSFYQAKPRWGIQGIYVVTESKNIPEVRNTVLKVFEGVKKSFSASEIQWARESILNSYAAPFNSPLSILTHSMDMAFYGVEKDFDKNFIEKVGTATEGEISKAALKLVSGPWVEVIVNP